MSICSLHSVPVHFCSIFCDNLGFLSTKKLLETEARYNVLDFSIDTFTVFYPWKFTLCRFIMQADFCGPYQTSQNTLHNYDPGTFMPLAIQSPSITI